MGTSARHRSTNVFLTVCQRIVADERVCFLAERAGKSLPRFLTASRWQKSTEISKSVLVTVNVFINSVRV